MTRPTFQDPTSESELRRFGFTRCDLLDTSEVTELSAALERVGHAPDDPRASIHFGFFSDHAPWKRRVAEEVAAVVGERLRTMFVDQEPYFTMIVTKWPGALGTFAPHQDPSFVDESSHRTTTVWCPLGPTGTFGGADNGQLHLVPGSHLTGPDVRVNDTSQFAHRASEEIIVSELGVAVPTSSGQAVVFDNRTIHYSFPNRSSSPRTVIAIGLRPVEADLLHFEVSKDSVDKVDVHEIDEQYFFDLNPLRIQLSGTGRPVARTVPRPDPVPTDVLLAAATRAGAPDFAEPAAADRLEQEVAYCFVCGGTRDLLRDPDQERGGMAICAKCVASALEADDATGAVASQLIPAPDGSSGQARVPVEASAPMPETWLQRAVLRARRALSSR